MDQGEDDGGGVQSGSGQYEGAASPSLESWLSVEVDTVPDHRGFLSADELEAGLIALAAGFPGVASLRTAGWSRLGDPISALTIATEGVDGAEVGTALVFGLPHPNEPIGGLTGLHLARRLCDDENLRRRLGLEFTIVACIDPDGLRLNEGWLRGPFNRTHYAQHFYRPAGDEQIEWTFPLDHRGVRFDAPLPETSALMTLIDELRPALMVSLHNSELGGAYYYLSRPEPELYPVLQALPEYVGVPLDRGEAEHPSIPPLADGIFHGLSMVSTIDYLHALDVDVSTLRAGDCSASYAGRHGTLTLLSEVPYWTDPRCTDTGSTEQRYSEVLTRQADDIHQLATTLADIMAAVEPALTAVSPYLAASRFFVRDLLTHRSQHLPRLADPATQRPATQAEVFTAADRVHSYRLRFGGMLIRALDAELAIGNHRRVIREQQSRLGELLQAWYAEADAAGGSEALPIRSVVAIQYGAILAAAAHLTRTRRDSSDSGPDTVDPVNPLPPSARQR